MAQGKISAKQEEILEYIKSQILERGFPPSVRDICEAVHLKSTSSIHSHLESLEKNGYKQIKPAFNRPQKGDIYIIDATSDHVYGHIAGYTGSEWISDFRQSGYAVYREKDVEYHYYRLEPATEL